MHAVRTTYTYVYRGIVSCINIVSLLVIKSQAVVASDHYSHACAVAEFVNSRAMVGAGGGSGRSTASRIADAFNSVSASSASGLESNNNVAPART